MFGAYFKLQSFVFMPVFGLNNGMVPIISYNYGAARPAAGEEDHPAFHHHRHGHHGCGLCRFSSCFPRTLLNFFDASEEHAGHRRPSPCGSSAFPSCWRASASSPAPCVQAIGNPVYSLIVSVCRQLVVLLPVAWLLSRTGRLELVWWSFPIAEVMSFTLSTIFLRRTVKSANEVMNSSAD